MKTRKGFTLIELLVVIAIIGLLSTLAVVALNSARKKSRDAKRVSDVRQVQTALELYYNDQNGYPATCAVLGVLNCVCLGTNGWGAAGGCVAMTTTYMGLVPGNPTPGGANYVYTQVGGGTGYTITFTLEGITGGLAAGAHTASESGIQ